MFPPPHVFFLVLKQKSDFFLHEKSDIFLQILPKVLVENYRLDYFVFVYLHLSMQIFVFF